MSGSAVKVFCLFIVRMQWEKQPHSGRYVLMNGNNLQMPYGWAVSIGVNRPTLGRALGEIIDRGLAHAVSGGAGRGGRHPSPSIYELSPGMVTLLSDKSPTGRPQRKAWLPSDFLLGEFISLSGSSAKVYLELLGRAKFARVKRAVQGGYRWSHSTPVFISYSESDRLLGMNRSTFGRAITVLQERRLVEVLGKAGAQNAYRLIDLSF